MLCLGMNVHRCVYVFMYVCMGVVWCVCVCGVWCVVCVYVYVRVHVFVHVCMCSLLCLPSPIPRQANLWIFILSFIGNYVWTRTCPHALPMTLCVIPWPWAWECCP
jgi:hypothetical protein